MSQGEPARSEESGTPVPVSSSTLPALPEGKDDDEATAKPQRKIKPPSASFLSASPSPAEVEPVSHVARELEGPSSSAGSDILFEGPAPTASVIQAAPPVPVASPASEELAASEVSAVEEKRPIEERGIQASYSKERLQAELRELMTVISGVDSLKFLMPRMNRSMEEGAEALTLVSFYRIASRTLLEEVQQAKANTELIRRELDLSRSRLNKKELELAAAEAANPVAASGGPPSKDVQEKLLALQADLDKVNEQREKLLVDFRNMRDRTVKDVEIRVFKEKEKFFRSFLPVLDSFERAQQTMLTSDAAALRDGMNLIATQVSEALRQEGLEPVDVSGVFDPRYHEAVGEVVTQEKEDEHVFDELSRGYRLGERLIRPAMIRIARNPSGTVKAPVVEASAPSQDGEPPGEE